jgi:hypothetical protein
LTRDSRGNSTYVPSKLNTTRRIPLAGFRKICEADPDEVELGQVKEMMLEQAPAGAFSQYELSVVRGSPAKRMLGEHTPCGLDA